MEMKDLLTVLTTIFGTGGFGFMVAKAARDWRQNKVEDEKAYNRRMIREARDNDARADMEITNRLAWQVYSSRLKRLLIEHGFPEQDIPPEPIDKKCPNSDG